MPDLRGLPIRRSQPNQRRARVCLNSPLATARRRAPALARRSPTPRSGEQRLARRRRHLTGTQCNATPQSRIFARRPQSFAWATDMRHTLIANDHSPQPRLTPWTATALLTRSASHQHPLATAAQQHCFFFSQLPTIPPNAAALPCRHHPGQQQGAHALPMLPRRPWCPAAAHTTRRRHCLPHPENSTNNVAATWGSVRVSIRRWGV